MSATLPSVRPAAVMRALARVGFVEVRVKGSHHRFVHRTDPTRATTVPVHQGHDMPLGTLRSILKQAGLTVDEFIALL